MKKTHLIIYLLASVILLNSCDNWLYLEPEDGMVGAEFWKSKEDVESAVLGVYCSLLGNFGTKQGYSIPEQLFLWGEARADMVIPYRLKTDFNYIYNGDILPTNGVCKWNNFYRTINYCNIVLEKAPEVKTLDKSFSQEQLNYYQSEAYAIRSLMYFYLVRTFGEAPLKLNATTNDNENFVISKSSRSTILSQIKSDLAKAEKIARYTYNDNNSDKGRITKFTINAIQADVYLWCDQYDSCLYACDKIINSGLFGLIEGNDNWFRTLYVNGNSSESIFELQFSQSKLNPYYSYFASSTYYIASPSAVEEYFPLDENAPLDSADIRSDWGSYSISYNYTIWKYIGMNREYVRSPSQSYAHFIIYRYADILLLKAEALAQISREKEAIDLIYTIRKRAHAALTTEQDTAGYNRKSVVDYILAERAREFAFEGKRWFDLLRNAKRNNYERIDILDNMVARAAPSDRVVTIKNKYKDTLSHYFPIHIDEIRANPALEQNKFYVSE